MTGQFSPVRFTRAASTKAYGESARFVQDQIGLLHDSMLRTNSLAGDLQRTFQDLMALRYRCCEIGWDGYRAFPVSQATVENVYRFLAGLPKDISRPEFSPEPDGEVALEWFSRKDWGLSLSMGDASRLSYAAIFGPARVHGREPFTENVPGMVIELIRRAQTA